MSILMFFWPANRLLAIFLVVLNLVSCRFCYRLSLFRNIFSATRIERKHRETLLSRASELEALVTQRTREAEDARPQSEFTSSSKSDFVANMSHEIRTPMTAIVGYTDLLENGGGDDLSADLLHEYVRTIKRNGEHLLSIINDILDLSKIEAGKMTVERLEVNPRVLINEVADLMKVKAEAKRLTIIVDFQEVRRISIQTDSTQLRQILVNLIGNAVKFTESGSVTIRTRLLTSDAPSFEIQVADTGIGLSDEQIPCLFGTFQQADTSTTRKFGGTGLGLMISKRFAELLGGDITVTSARGWGSTFCVHIHPGEVTEIPSSQIDQEASRSSSALDANSADPIPLQGMRILFAEDGPDNQRVNKDEQGGVF